MHDTTMMKDEWYMIDEHQWLMIDDTWRWIIHETWMIDDKW